MNAEEKLKVFKTYLIRRMSHVQMLIAVTEQSGDDEAIKWLHRRRDELDDIIHDFDALVNT